MGGISDERIFNLGFSYYSIGKDWYSDYTAEDIEILNKLGKTVENSAQHG